MAEGTEPYGPTMSQVRYGKMLWIKENWKQIKTEKEIDGYGTNSVYRTVRRINVSKTFVIRLFLINAP